MTTARKVLLVELNEINWRVIDSLIAQHGKRYLPNRDDSLGFAIDFAGPMLADPAQDASLAADISTDANGTIVGREIRRNPETGGVRLELRFKRNDNSKPVELRAALRNGTTVSETWSYALPPG